MDDREQQYRRLLLQRHAGRAQAAICCAFVAILLSLMVGSLALGKCTLRQALIPFGAACVFLLFAAILHSLGRDLSRLAKHHRQPSPKDLSNL